MSSYYYLYFLLSIVVRTRQFNVIISVISIHYYVAYMWYMVPGGFVFTFKSVNVFVRTLLY